MARRGWLAVAVLCAAVGCVHGAQDAKSLEAFVTWFEQRGGVATNVSLSHFNGMGIGLVASGTTYDGMPALRVPLSAVMCDATMLGMPAGPVLDVLTSTSDGEERLALFLMRQLALGEASPWAPYIAVLPAHVPVTLWWDEGALQGLGDQAAAGSSRSRRAQVVSRFHAATSALAVVTAEKPEVGTLENWLWAHSIIDSRALNLRGVKYLVPFADFFNYQPHANLRKSAAGSHFLQYHTVSDTHFTVTADRVAVPGEQLAEDYGDNSNDVYIQYHGFVPVDNPFGCWQFPVPSSASLRKRGQGQRRLALFKALMMREATAWNDMCLVPGRPIPPVVYSVLHVQRAGGPQLAKCKRFVANPRSAEAYSTCFGASQGTPSAMRSIVKVLRKAMARLPGTQEGDEEAVAALAGPAQDAEAGVMAESPGSVAVQALLAPLQDFLVVRYRLATRHVMQGLVDDMLVQLPADSGSPPPLDSTARRAARASRLDQAKGTSATVDAEGGVATPTPAPVVEEERGPFSPRSEQLPLSPGARVLPGASAQDQVAALETLVAEFNAWFNAFNPPMAAVEAAVVGDGMRLGVVATRDIVAEEVYLTVPLPAIMSAATAAASPALAPVFADLAKRFPRGDEFHQLLFHLMYETFVAGVGSAWAPYLATLPTSAQMGFPVFYSAAQLQELTGSPVLAGILNNREGIQRKFKGIQTAVFQAYPDVFPPQAFSFENYLWATAILDSRSIWWDGARHLVPMLDLINCAEGPRPERVHSTVTDAAGDNAVTKAGWDFPAGSQLWENYGQPNSIYFHYHGFTMQPNSHDCADVEVQVDLVDPAALSRVQARQWPASITACVSPPGEGVPKQDTSNGYGVPDRALEYAVEALDTNEAGAVEAIAQLAAMQLSKYPTTIAQDEALLARSEEDGTFIDVDSAILKFRLAQKTLLSRWIAAVGGG